jgi:microsomal dipeptidase-like Zn-dependent dipeptidase
MRCRIATLVLSLAVLALPAPASAAPGDEAVYGLVHGCYGLRSVDAQKFVAKQASGGYALTADTVGGAEPFRMQATALGRYMLYGKAGDFLAAGSGDAVEVVGGPGAHADWKVAPGGGAFRLTLNGTNRALATDQNGRLVTTIGSGTPFTFEKAEGCATFPEAELNVTGEPSKGVSPFSQVRGTVDAHMHMMAFEFLGGKAHCGRPWSPYGITEALRDCPDHEPAQGAGAVLENAVSTRDEPLTHHSSGWPEFQGWPSWGSLTHEQSYYKWVERAYRAGLRVYVNLLVENKVLCQLYPLKQNDCDEMASLRLQARRIRELEDYVDAQEGGPGKGWFRIVETPAEARRVVNDGKLAVVLGMELSEPFGCQVYADRPLCDQDDIRRGLDEVHKLGVRQMELINKFDNALAGVAGDNGTTGLIVNTGNKLETGSFWAMETCTGPPEESDREQPTGLPVEHNHDDLTAAVLTTFAQSGVAPVYGPGPHCNRRGLTALGRFAVEQAMARGIMIDPDHLSVKARKELMPIVEAKNYPGVMSSHSWSTVDTYPRIYKLGGIVTPYAGSSQSFVNAWKQLKPMRDPRWFWGLGYGADMNGLGKQGRPRGADAKNPVTYPFKALDPNVTVHQNRTGSRTWDINRDGVAHYGLYADWIEDLRKLAGDAIVEDLARGAEAYLQMWERVEGARPRTCMPVRRRLTRRGLEDVQVGRSVGDLLRQAGQPDARPGRAFEYCAQLGGGKHGKVTAVLSETGRVVLVGSRNRIHRASGIGIGDRASRLKRKKGVRTFGRRDVLVRRLAGGNRFVWGVRKGRVRWTAVVSGRVGKDARELRRALRLAGLR